MSQSPNPEEQEVEINPDDIWLMRAAGGEDEVEEGVAENAVRGDEDQFSFEDSERFEEDSLCSWVSDAESLNQNWRGWNAPGSSNPHLAASDIVYSDILPMATTSHRYLSGYSSGSLRSRHSSSGTLKVNSPTTGSSLRYNSRSLGSVANNPQSLAEIAARKAAKFFSFNALETSYRMIIAGWRRRREHKNFGGIPFVSDDAFAEHVAIPDKFFLSIVRWCFPESEEDIRLYSCLANGNVEEFGRGEYLYQTDAVRDIVQIGYHLSATVLGSVLGSMSGELVNSSVSPAQNLHPGRQLSKAAHNVSVRIDRCRIVSCTCSCNHKSGNFEASWCQHVVAACLHRINRNQEVQYRVTIWDAINELNLRELKKFAQFFINELPRQYLPVAQRLIDQLRDPGSEINIAVGAPDPTDGGHDDCAIWCLDQKMLQDNISRILAKFCLPSPTVHCDVHYLSSSQPAAAAEWQLLLRPHRSKEPEGLWNLMSIIREMFKRRDENATTLLHIVTEEFLGNSQVLIWWYQTSLTHSGRWFLCSAGNKPNPIISNQCVPQFSCASLCEEIIQLWKYAALNPKLSSHGREQLVNFLQLYHRNACEKIWRIIRSSDPRSIAQSQSASLVFSVVDRKGERLSLDNARFTADLFPGFFNALKACYVDWQAFEWENADMNDTRSSSFERFFSTVQSSFQASDVNQCKSPCPLNYLTFHRFIRFSENATEDDRPSTSGCHITHHRHHRNPEGTSHVSKRKKKAKLVQKRGYKPQLPNQGAVIRSAQLDVLHVREEVEEESAESGQESEDGGSSSKASTSNVELPASMKSRSTPQRPEFPFEDINELLAFTHEPMRSFDLKFMKFEALTAHGYHQLACKLAVELANEIMRSSVKHDFEKVGNHEENSEGTSFDCEKVGGLAELPNAGNSQNALVMFTRVNSIIQTLVKERVTQKLAFGLAIFVLEMPRSPALTKFLEVKLYHLEMELVSLLRRIEITQTELNMVRECARRFIANALARSAKMCVLPISLAHYILDALSYTHNVTAVSQGRRIGCIIPTRGNVQRYPNDEELSVKVALEVLNMKLLVSEADNPMLCESTRRQRGDLALTMLTRYKDSVEKIAVVLDGLLDPKMHRMYKDHLSNAAYFVEQDPTCHRHFTGQRPKYPSQGQDAQWLKENAPQQDGFPDGFSSMHLIGENAAPFPSTSVHFPQIKGDRGIPRLSDVLRECGKDFESELCRKNETSEDGTDGVSEDSSCTKESSALLESESVSGRGSGSVSPSSRLPKRDGSLTDASVLGTIRLSDLGSTYFRYPRRKPIPSSPNQPSEAHAHYMMELAKRLLVEAGGSQSTAVFNATQSLGMQNNPQHLGPHRNLHICSFLIGLYALGLSNVVSPSWQTRTYSTNVSWISGQAVEIGCSAIRIIERVWESHLTPTEAADLADKASQSRDPGMVEAAAKLALSVLPKAYALTATESQTALHLCREQSSEMLERACHAVEQAADIDGVYPEVLFKVAHLWYDLFCECDAVNSRQCSSNSSASSTSVPPSPPAPTTATNNVIVQQLPAFSPCVSTQPPVQMSAYHPRQQGLCSQPSFYHVPPPHAQSIRRSAVFFPPGSPVQPQIVMSYGTCPLNVTQQPIIHLGTQQHNGRHSNQAILTRPSPQTLPITVAQQPLLFSSIQQQPMSGFTQPPPLSNPGRVLHVSHSAPNLNPVQVSVSACRRAMPGHMSSNSQHYSQVATIPEHVSQSPVIQRQHQFMPSMVMSSSTVPNQVNSPAVILPVYYGQTSQVNPSTMFNGDPRMAKLVHAHRVGMKAMETMGNRNRDDPRGYAKFSQNTAYADDVQWLFSIAVKLGGVFVQSFCEVAGRAVTSPFILFKLTRESREVFKGVPAQPGYHPNSFTPFMRSQYATPLKFNPTPKDVRILMVQNGCDPLTADLMQHCVEMFYSAATSKLSHPRFVPSDTEEVVQLVRTARDAFYTIPIHGKSMFEEFLRHVKKQKACKRDVIERIKTCLQPQMS